MDSLHLGKPDSTAKDLIKNLSVILTTEDSFVIILSMKLLVKYYLEAL
jgi:hypothetical protein